MNSKNKKMHLTLSLIVLLGLSSCFGPFAKDKKESSPPFNSETPVTTPPCEKTEQGVKLSGGRGQLAMKPDDIEEITPKRVLSGPEILNLFQKKAPAP